MSWYYEPRREEPENEYSTEEREKKSNVTIADSVGDAVSEAGKDYAFVFVLIVLCMMMLAVIAQQLGDNTNIFSNVIEFFAQIGK